MGDTNMVDIKTLILLQRAATANATLTRRLKRSEDLHREKDQVISWMSGGYSITGSMQKDIG